MSIFGFATAASRPLLEPKNLDLSDVESSSTRGASVDGGALIRLFGSSVFDGWLAMVYLHRTSVANPPQRGVRDFICNRLYSMNHKQIEPYLAQLLSIIVELAPDDVDGLQRYLISLCKQTLTVGLKVHWYLLAACTDHANNVVFQRLIESCFKATVDGTWPRPWPCSDCAIEENDKLKHPLVRTVEGKLGRVPSGSRKDGDLGLRKANSESALLERCSVSPEDTRRKIFTSTLQFVQALCDTGAKLVAIQPVSARQRALQSTLLALNTDVMDKKPHEAVAYPLRNAFGRIVGIAVDETLLLNSKERAPYMIFVEVILADTSSKNRGKDLGAAPPERPAVLPSPSSSGLMGIDIVAIYKSVSASAPVALASAPASATSSSIDLQLPTTATTPSPAGPDSQDGLPVSSQAEEQDLSAAREATAVPQTHANGPASKSAGHAGKDGLKRVGKEDGIISSAQKPPMAPRSERQQKTIAETIEFAMAELHIPKTREAHPVEVLLLPVEGNAAEANGDEKGRGGGPYIRVIISEQQSPFSSSPLKNVKRIPSSVALEEARAIHHATKEKDAGQQASEDGEDGSQQVTPDEISQAVRLKGEGIGYTSEAGDGTGLGFDKQTYSKALTGELFAEKEARLRKLSPSGHLDGWCLKSFIVKSGDDCRQEELAVRLVQQFRDIIVEEQLPLWIRPYEVLVTSHNTALIETITDAVSVHGVKSRMDGGSIRDHFLQKYGQGTDALRTAQRNFVESMAAYSIFCYVMQVKDRHNGNIMLDEEGHIIHIDFGFMLGNSPGNVNFESAPFKLTREYLEVMDSDSEGTPSELFNYFKVLCIQAFLAARKHHERILTLVDIAASMPFKCFKGGASRSIAALKSRLQLGRRDQQCVSLVLSLIGDSLDSWRTRQYDIYQRAWNGIN